MDNKFSTQEKEILIKLTRWCSGGEKCPDDIRRWFLRKQISLTGINRMINYLKENDFVNEVRYATAFAHDKFLFNYWGRLKISAELTKKQIPQQIIHQAIESEINENDYLNMLQNLLKKKKKLLDNKDISVVKQKIRNFAFSKGFESDLIYQETEKLTNK